MCVCPHVCVCVYVRACVGCMCEVLVVVVTPPRESREPGCGSPSGGVEPVSPFLLFVCVALSDLDFGTQAHTSVHMYTHTPSFEHFTHSNTSHIRTLHKFEHFTPANLVKPSTIRALMWPPVPILGEWLQGTRHNKFPVTHGGSLESHCIHLPASALGAKAHLCPLLWKVLQLVCIVAEHWVECGC